MPNKILLVDDDPAFCAVMRAAFDRFQIEHALNEDQFLEKAKQSQYDLVLLDLKLSDSKDLLGGLSLIGPCKRMLQGVPVVVVTSDNQIETVVSAIKLGADDFLRKAEFDLTSWSRRLNLILENSQLRSQLTGLRSEAYPFVGKSEAIEEVRRSLRVLAQYSDVTVLVSGETGVGKEVAARYLHSQGTRSEKPFVAVNLSSINDGLHESSMFGHERGAYTGATVGRRGLFRSADGGVLFLDEVSNLSPALQTQLLRFLDEKKIIAVGSDQEILLDLQIIAATNEDLSKLVSLGRFRADLYYRLRHYLVTVPPLRERSDDIRAIMQFYADSRGYGPLNECFEPAIITLCEIYPWPGNVRELRNTVDYMLLRTRILGKDRVDLACLPDELREYSLKRGAVNHAEMKQRPVGLQEQVYQTELEQIECALEQTDGKKAHAAALLGLTNDMMRYRVVRCHREAPHLFASYKRISSAYSLLINGACDDILNK